jgi:dUTP pyrophosphatase
VSEPLLIDLVRLDDGLPLPHYARDGDAGMDLRSRVDATVLPGSRVLVPTGIACALPRGFGGFIVPRSGMALHHGVTVANSPGLIDCGYRDEIKVVLLNTDPHHAYEVRRGDRIAQLVVQRVEHVDWRVVSNLEGDNRGGGFGHTGR